AIDVGMTPGRIAIMTRTPPAESATLATALKGRKHDRAEAVRRWVEKDVVPAPDLVRPLIDALADRDAALAALITDRALPRFGPGACPGLLARFKPRGTLADARVLRAVCRIDPRRGAALCQTAATGG